MQSPLLEPFQKHDINWLLHVTIGHGNYNHIKITIIPWDRFKHFVQREYNYLEFPCKFTRINEHKICNPLNTLTHPKANFAVCVYRCCFISNVILIFKNAIVVIFVCYHSLSLLQLGFEMFHMRKCLFSRSQVEITSITIGCKTTLHQFMKFKNINHFFKAIDWKILSSSFQSLHP
jgi:hypothetical protein